jgi:hypothetical protein
MLDFGGFVIKSTSGLAVWVKNEALQEISVRLPSKWFNWLSQMRLLPVKWKILRVMKPQEQLRKLSANHMTDKCIFTRFVAAARNQVCDGELSRSIYCRAIVPIVSSVKPILLPKQLGQLLYKAPRQRFVYLENAKLRFGVSGSIGWFVNTLILFWA